MGAPLLALNGVEVRRGMRVVLKDHTIEVKAGELVALVGSNGSGKSTLLETAVGLLPLERGTVRHGEVDVLDADGRQRSSPLSIGLTLQKNGMLGSEIVSEHLEIACSMRGFAVDFTRFLDGFSLSHRQNDLVTNLSQGQARKVAVLAGLLPAFASDQPALVLLDEPAAGLDDAAVEALCDWLTELRLLGHGLMVCTHDQRLLNIATAHHDIAASSTMPHQPAEASVPTAMKRRTTRGVSPASFGISVHRRTMLWLNQNAMAALLTLGVLLSLGEFMSALNSMQQLGMVLAPALAAGLCGEALVAATQEERSNAWWRAVGGGVPHAGWLPLFIGAAITVMTIFGLQTSLNLNHVVIGSLLCWCVWHGIRWTQLSTQRLARPRAVFVGLLTPVLILPYALLIDFLTR
jgi:ABC-type lipoprotein export system ATPase subunit